MANETIELLKEFNWTMMYGPAGFQEKLDGVPTRIIRRGTEVVALTRQGERITSIPHILPHALLLLQDGGSIIGELYIQGKPFKDISGAVRKDKRNDDLKLYVFDADIRAVPTLHYETRREAVNGLLDKLATYLGRHRDDLPIQLIPQHVVYTEAEALESFDQLMKLKPNAEGAVLHRLTKCFEPGKRCWGTQRLKPVPAIDLKVVGFEEAVSKAGKPLGMVGRIEVEFTRLHNGTPRMAHIGVGPGCLTHAERIAIWRSKSKYIGRIAEVRYMRDETYEALRQPTFLRWRLDKKEPS